jgi:hypothetical protein
MTERERTEGLVGILEHWQGVLDRYENEAGRREEAMRREALEAEMEHLIEQGAQTRRWITGAVVIMVILTVIRAGIG